MCGKENGLGLSAILVLGVRARMEAAIKVVVVVSSASVRDLAGVISIAQAAFSDMGCKGNL